MVRPGSDHSDFDAVLGVPAGVTIKDVDVLTGVEVIDSSLAVDLESVLVELDVDWTPPDVLGTGLFVDDTLVLGRTTGLLAREVDEGTLGGDDGSFVQDGVFVERSDGSIALVVNHCYHRIAIRSDLS